MEHHTEKEEHQNLYIVSGNTCKEYGCEIYIFAICDTEEQAKKEKEKLRCSGEITKVKLNKFKPIYLGGYME